MGSMGCIFPTSVIAAGGLFYTGLALASLAVVTLVVAVAFPKLDTPYVKVAMIGNSMIYYNDFPRFMGELLFLLLLLLLRGVRNIRSREGNGACCSFFQKDRFY